jgi:phospholipase C
MRRNVFLSRPLAIAAFGLALSACSTTSSLNTLPSSTSLGHVHYHTSSNPIQHVIIVIQENRSFNNLFKGFKGATTASYGYNTSNQKITLQPYTLASTWDLEHDSSGFFAACNGTGSIPGTDCRMNGFNNEWVGCGYSCPANPQYIYVPRSEITPYWDMAKQYVLADEMYASNFDASSFISHQYFISGQAEHAVNFPGGAWGCPGGSGDFIDEVGPSRQIPYGYEVVCWDPTTLGDELDDADPSIPWAFYTATVSGDLGIWSAYQAIKHIYYGTDWKKDILTPQSRFFSDVKYGRLRNVSWITPTWENSDHPGSGEKTGPSWVASIVNAIGQSQYWDSTAIFIFWDDYGGEYDPEPPAHLDFDGLGMRIPMIVVSAYAKKGYVSHTHYEHGSVLKFIEDIWGLPRMTASDTRANSPIDCFDFSQPPRKFKKIAAAFDENYFLDQPSSHRAPDDH